MKTPETLYEDYRESDKQPTDNEVRLLTNSFLSTIHLRIAEVKFLLGEPGIALTEINNAITVCPKAKDMGMEFLYHIRGSILLALGKTEDAKNDFDTCIQLNPKFVESYTSRAIAAISLSGKFELKPASIMPDSDNQAFKATWILPVNMKIKETDANIIAAMNDCNKAIELDPKNDMAYYIRGVIKKVFKKNDYCDDLLKAKQLGFTADMKILKDCGK